MKMVTIQKYYLHLYFPLNSLLRVYGQLKTMQIYQFYFLFEQMYNKNNVICIDIHRDLKKYY